MNREEMIKELKTVYLGDSIKMREAKNMAIEALEQEPCEDAISRQVVLAIAGDSCLDLDSYEDTREFCDEINDLPSVTPQPKMGKWEYVQYEGFCGSWHCSECSYKVYGRQTNYCPNCGAKMTKIPTGAEGSEEK